MRARGLFTVLTTVSEAANAFVPETVHSVIRFIYSPPLHAH